MHDETLPDDYYKEAHFCSMNWSLKVDEFNKGAHGLEKRDLSALVRQQAELLATKS